jgi:hypothetical protein
MQKSVLAEIVKSLQKKEIRELNKWLQSPAHNQRKDVVRLFEFMVKNTASTEDGFIKEKAWKYIFPREPFDDAYMRQVMYFLLKAVEEYLVFAESMDDRVRMQVALSRIYRQRKLDKAYRQAQRIGREHLEDQPLRNGYYLLNRFFLEQEEYEHKLSITQNDSVNLQEMADALEVWFLSERLALGNAMLAHRKVYQKANYNDGLLPQALPYITEKGLLDASTLALNYYSYMLSSHPDEETYYDHFEALLEEAPSKASKSEVRNYYLTALNYCIGKINRGRPEFTQRVFALYKSGFNTGVLIENDDTFRYTFGNAVGAALRNRDYEWAEQFIEKYQQHLEERHRDSVVKFNLSRVYFEKKDYDKAQRLLAYFEYDDLLFNIIAKTMLLKIYFELDEYDAFESLLDSLRIYLQRKEALDPARKTAYKNMISLMKKLLSLKIHSRAEREKFRALIMETNPLMERDWLLEQVKDTNS